MTRLFVAIERLLAAILGVITALVIYQATARYLFNSPPSWTEELARYLQVWMVMLAAPVCLHRGMHLAVDYVTPRLPPARRAVARAFLALPVGVFSLVLTVYGVRLLRVAAIETSPALGTSMIWPYLAVPVGGALLTIESCRAVARIWRGPSRLAARQ